MSKYKWREDGGVKNLETGEEIPPDKTSPSWQEFLQWEKETGGTPDPADVYRPTYVEKRREEYPSMGDQLDVLMKIVDALQIQGIVLPQEGVDWIAACKEVKNKYPKPIE